MGEEYNSLVKEMRDVLRKKAKEFDSFGHGRRAGCIRICACPLCEDADQWLGGLGDFSRDVFHGNWRSDIVDYEHTFSIVECGSRVIKNHDYQFYDTYSITAMKVATCSRLQEEHNLNYSKPAEQWIEKEFGYAPYYGAYCVEIKKDKKSWLLIYVSISGGTQADDLKTAKAAIPVIRKFFKAFKKDYSEYTVRAPRLPKIE